MGAFGIFIMVLTLLYVVYYGAMIFMDLYGKGSKGNGSVEVIQTQPGVEAKALEEAPTEVLEEDYGKKPDGEEIPDDEPMTAEEIAKLQTDIMYEEHVKACGSLQKIHAKAQSEVSLTKDEDLAKELFLANMMGSEDWGDGKEEE